MTSYFDPRSWSPLRAAGIGKSWFDQWVALTTSWVDPVATLGAGTVTALMPDVVMTALTDGISRQFGGRTIDVTLHGRPVRALLTSLEVRRQGATFRAEVELSNLDWGGRLVREVTMVANVVRLVPGVPTRVHAEQIDVQGMMTMHALVNWLNELDLEWELEVLDSGLIGARHREKNLRIVADASVSDDVVRVQIRNARWRGMPMPQGLLGVRMIPIAGMIPGDIRIVRATREATMAHFILDVPDVSGAVDLAQMRDAILAGTRLIVW